jgi:hypothetical protein
VQGADCVTYPAVIVMPGASLMEITFVAGGARVRCPGCDADQEFRTGTASPAAFVHFEGCPVYRRILNALEQFERTALRGARA